MKILAQGAEAIITLSNNIVTKDRISKSYRLPILDDKIRSRRTRSETKLLIKASKIINCPVPFSDKADGRVGGKTIHMPFIDGKKLSQHLNEFPLTKQKQICEQIGQSIAKLHDNDIIHGDLTTSNMILVSPSQGAVVGVAGDRTKVYFIDFGLGFQSSKYEDKAVDLHLLRQALEAKHFKHWESLFNSVIKAYKSKDTKIILERLKAVEKRGRYKH